MVSPELLRRYSFFSFADHDQLQEVAMITDEVKVAKGDALFTMGGKAQALYLLMEGSVDLHHVVVDERGLEPRQDFMVGTINPGEVLSISAVIEPYELTSTAVATKPSRLLKMDAVKLRELSQEDATLGCGLQRQIARAAMERLHATRILLAAATTPAES